MNRIPRTLRLAALAAGVALLPLAAWAAPEPIIVKVQSDAVVWFPQTDYKLAELAVAGPDCVSVTQLIPRGEPIVFRNVDDEGKIRPDGGYSFDVRLTPFIESRRPEEVGGGDPQICRGREDLPGLDVLTSVGYVTILDGRFVDPDKEEDPRFADPQAISSSILDGDGFDAAEPGSMAGGVRNITAADQVIPDDLIVQRSLCVGFDCVNGETFNADTIRLKENNLRIHFDDTSTLGGFANRDWRIIANDQASGGANKFSIQDATANRTPFTIEGNAPTNSLFVDDGGRVGFGTAAPSVELHVRNGDTPTLRLEQDGSSGFGAQTWDVAGNETNFFVRDVTSGSRLPFRIRPGAPTNSINIADDGNVGLGTASPGKQLHVRRTDGTAGVLVEEASGTLDNNRVMMEIVNNGRAQFRLRNTGDATGLSWFVSAETGGNFGISREATGQLEVQVTPAGNMIITGNYTPDYVFEPDYPLMPLADLETFIEENKHLPNVPNAKEIAENGIVVNDFPMALLEKIEELTLYLLEQERDNRELRERLEKLESAASAAEVVR
jgi:hypothetical protein